MSWFWDRGQKAPRAKRLRGACAAIVLPLLALGCASEGGEESGGIVKDTTDTVRSLYGFLLGTVDGTAGGLLGGQPKDQAFGKFTLKCPTLEVRAGSSHYIFYAPNEPPSPKTVRYQGTLTQTARECEFKPDSIKFKFGFAGRVLLGPRGEEASVEMPVRALLAWRNDQVAWTKVYKVPVTIKPGEVSGFFVHVEDNFDYTVPEGHRLSEYRLYIGFDAKGGRDRGVPAPDAEG